MAPMGLGARDVFLRALGGPQERAPSLTCPQGPQDSWSPPGTGQGGRGTASIAKAYNLISLAN